MKPEVKEERKKLKANKGALLFKAKRRKLIEQFLVFDRKSLPSYNLKLIL
jgi:hypothetical protein